MQTSGDNVPCPHENRIRTSDLPVASTLLFVTETTKNALSLRITVLDELRLCLLICSTKIKIGLQQHHVKTCKYGICMEYGRFVPFHTSNLPFHIPCRFFPSIPYHSMPWCQELSVVSVQSQTHYSSNAKMTTAGLYLWRQNTHYCFDFTIEHAQHVMLFLCIGSQNGRVFLFGSGYRSVGDDKVRTKR